MYNLGARACVCAAGHLSYADGSQSSSSSSNLPLYVGVPAGGVLVLVILAILLLQNRKKCNTSRAALKRHRLPVPTHERDAGFYNTYHPSPATTNTVGGTGTASRHRHYRTLRLITLTKPAILPRGASCSFFSKCQVFDHVINQ